jgi:hypothetical protein
MGTVGDAVAYVFLFAGDAELPPVGPRGDYQGAGPDDFAGGQSQHLDIARFDGLDAQVFLQRDVVVLEVGPHAIDDLGPGGRRHRHQVLDAHGVLDLATEAFGDQRDRESLAGGIDGRRYAGRPATDDGNVLKRQFSARRCARFRQVWIPGEQLLDDGRRVDLAIGERLAVQEHGGNALDVA